MNKLTQDVLHEYLKKKYKHKKECARRRKLTFSLSFEDLAELYKTPYCYYTGVELGLNELSVERVDNSIGYTKENTVLCDRILNQKKGWLSFEEISCLYQGIVKHQLEKEA